MPNAEREKSETQLKLIHENKRLLFNANGRAQYPKTKVNPSLKTKYTLSKT